MRRRFLVDEEIREGDRLALPPGESRHALRVLRLREGEEIEVAAAGGIFSAVIEKVEKGAAWIVVSEPLPVRPLADITLAVGLAHRKAMDDVVRKAAELGVRRILPLSCRRGESMARETLLARRTRLFRVAKAAAKQSRRTGVPEILEAATIETIEGLSFRTGLLFAPGRPNPAPADFARGGPFLLVVGPEGGFAEEELGRMGKAGLLMRGLPCPVLRVETAIVAAVMVTLLLSQAAVAQKPAGAG